jgi:ABC-type Mn2+/Zn2+ transport system ATPase subunit
MQFCIEINRIQRVSNLSLQLDLNKNKITCVVGKNGVGKTTLVRALRNLSYADTFVKTAAQDIFSSESFIDYQIDDKNVRFEYDPQIRSLNCKQPISAAFRQLCAVELPMPHGERFRYFQSVSDADTDIRRQIILEEYTRPLELIDFLTDVYGPDKFKDLVETKVRNRTYYCILVDGKRYIREDYLSSGEYFLLNLYRTIRSNVQLIVVDEIDMSLDAAAQVHLLTALRRFCSQYGRNVLFTTHSLAMMRTLDFNELLYMERQDGQTSLLPRSYSFINSMLFGFIGWDRYILTEDEVLAALLETIIQRHCGGAFFSHKIIYAGGGSQVTDLLRRNRLEHFLAKPENVIAVLDGDQSGLQHTKSQDVHCLPIQSVERALFEYYADSEFPYKLPAEIHASNAKELFRALQKYHVMSSGQIYKYIVDRNEQALSSLVAVLKSFLL